MTDPLLMSAAASAGLVGLGAWELAHGNRGSDGARFARDRELATLRRASGISLGLRSGRVLRAEPNSSVVLIGPSQSGKTLAAIVRAIKDWGPRPLLVLSVKGDVLEHTINVREQLGECKIFDPGGAQTVRTSSAWSPVAAAGTWQEARAVAAGLLQIGTPIDKNDREPFWRRTAARYLAPLLLAAHEAGATMGTVLRWADLVDQEEPRYALEQSGDPAAQVALEALESIWRADVRMQSSVLQTLSTNLDDSHPQQRRDVYSDE